MDWMAHSRSIRGIAPEGMTTGTPFACPESRLTSSGSMPSALLAASVFMPRWRVSSSTQLLAMRSVLIALPMAANCPAFTGVCEELSLISISFPSPFEVNLSYSHRGPGFLKENKPSAFLELGQFALSHGCCSVRFLCRMQAKDVRLRCQDSCQLQ